MNHFQQEETISYDTDLTKVIEGSKYETIKFLCDRFNYLADLILTFEKYEQFVAMAAVLEELEIDMKMEINNADRSSELLSCNP